MRKTAQQFNRNKETARALQRQTIEKHLKDRLGKLRYFGLPSSGLGDAIEWSQLFTEFVAVERGEKDKEWDLQHELALQSFRSGLLGRMTLFRGDIDTIIRRGKDSFGRRVVFPFDVVSLDYSGGLFYQGSSGGFERLKAVEAVIAQQGSKEANFALLVSCNLDQVDAGEVRKTIENIRTELTRYGLEADKVIDVYLDHPREEARLKIYFPYFVNQLAAKYHYNCETDNVVFYEGNKKIRMMAFRFYLSFDPRTESLRSPRERLSQILNRPLIEIVNGEPNQNALGLPKLTVPDRGRDAHGEGQGSP